VPLLAVGGGSFLIRDQVEGCNQVIRVEHHAVPNVMGAAIAQASGEVDQVFSNVTRDQAIAAAQTEAEDRAVAAGAIRGSLSLVEIEDIPLSYLPGDARRVRVRMIGDIGSDLQLACRGPHVWIVAQQYRFRCPNRRLGSAATARRGPTLVRQPSIRLRRRVARALTKDVDRAVADGVTFAWLA
jgi:hypothetical protein